MKKGLIISDLLMSVIVLSSIASILLSSYFLNYHSKELDFFTQKRMSFQYLIQKAKVSCRGSINSQNKRDRIDIYESAKIMNKYIESISAECDRINSSNKIKALSYKVCIYSNKKNTPFLNDKEGTSQFSKRNCRTGKTYVSE